MTVTEDGGSTVNQTLSESSRSWGIPAASTTMFDFDYTDGRDQLLRLYDKGTRRQWIGYDRLDWTLDVDPDGPSACPTRSTPCSARPGGRR